VLVALVLLGACSNSQASCAAPSSGSYSVALSYSQTVPAAIYCEGGATGDAESCSGPHPFDGATWTVSIDGTSATVTSGDGGAFSWSCGVITPNSSPTDTADGGLPGTGCYLLVTCGVEPGGAEGPIEVQIQLLPQAPNEDVLAIVHHTGGECCTDEYTGVWTQP
jgi:hypothetical protein